MDNNGTSPKGTPRGLELQMATAAARNPAAPKKLPERSAPRMSQRQNDKKPGDNGHWSGGRGTGDLWHHTFQAREAHLAAGHQGLPEECQKKYPTYISARPLHFLTRKCIFSFACEVPHHTKAANDMLQLQRQFLESLHPFHRRTFQLWLKAGCQKGQATAMQKMMATPLCICHLWRDATILSIPHHRASKMCHVQTNLVPAPRQNLQLHKTAGQVVVGKVLGHHHWRLRLPTQGHHAGLVLEPAQPMHSSIHLVPAGWKPGMAKHHVVLMGSTKWDDIEGKLEENAQISSKTDPPTDPKNLASPGSARPNFTKFWCVCRAAVPKMTPNPDSKYLVYLPRSKTEWPSKFVTVKNQRRLQKALLLHLKVPSDFAHRHLHLEITKGSGIPRGQD